MEVQNHWKNVTQKPFHILSDCGKIDVRCASVRISPEIGTLGYAVRFRKRIGLPTAKRLSLCKPPGYGYGKSEQMLF